MTGGILWRGGGKSLVGQAREPPGDSLAAWGSRWAERERDVAPGLAAHHIDALVQHPPLGCPAVLLPHLLQLDERALVRAVDQMLQRRKQGESPPRRLHSQFLIRRHAGGQAGAVEDDLVVAEGTR